MVRPQDCKSIRDLAEKYCANTLNIVEEETMCRFYNTILSSLVHDHVVPLLNKIYPDETKYA
jgi:hypothetical protein